MEEPLEKYVKPMIEKKKERKSTTIDIFKKNPNLLNEATDNRNFERKGNLEITKDVI